MPKRSFLHHAGVYALGDFLVMAGGFLLVPIYARCLSQADFGTLEVLERVAEIAAIFLVARGIPLAALAFYKQSESETQRRQAAGAAILFGLVTILLGAGAMALCSGLVSTQLHLEQPQLLWAATLGALLDGLGVVALATSQARLESVFYLSVSFAQFLFKVALCLFFVVGLGWGISGIVAAAVIRSFFFTVLLIGREWHKGLAWPDAAMLRAMLGFALPFVPTGLCFFVLNSADRFFLVRWADSAEVGIYGLGYKLAMLVGLFSLTPLYRVWSSRLYDVARQPNAATVFGQVTTWFLGCYLFLGLGLCVFQDEVIALFAGPAFAPAAVIVPFIVLAYAFQSASVLGDSAFYVRRQTRWKLGIALASTPVMLLLYAALIPAYGSLGAALATLLGFVVHAALTLVLAQRIFPVRYQYGRLLLLLLLAAGLWLCSRWVEPGLLALPLKAGLVLLWPAGLWAVGFFTPDESRWLGAIIGDGLRTVRRGVNKLTQRRQDAKEEEPDKHLLEV